VLAAPADVRGPSAGPGDRVPGDGQSRSAAPQPLGTLGEPERRVHLVHGRRARRSLAGAPDAALADAGEARLTGPVSLAVHALREQGSALAPAAHVLAVAVEVGVAGVAVPARRTALALNAGERLPHIALRALVECAARAPAEDGGTGSGARAGRLRNAETARAFEQAQARATP